MDLYKHIHKRIGNFSIHFIVDTSIGLGFHFWNRTYLQTEAKEFKPTLDIYLPLIQVSIDYN